MPHSLTGEATRFLDGLFTAQQIREQPQLVPALPGIYGWWFDDAFLADQTEGTLQRNGRRLLYVGIAPKGTTKPGATPRTLRDRLSDHCRGPIASSTLRRTLAALLAKELQLSFEVRPSGKVAMPAADEEKLTQWMAAHAGVMWSWVPEPWLVEAELLEAGPRLPLNIRGSNDPFRDILKSLRAAMRTTPPSCLPHVPDYRIGQASDIKMLGKVIRFEDHTTEEQRRINEEHAQLLNELSQAFAMNEAG